MRAVLLSAALLLACSKEPKEQTAPPVGHDGAGAVAPPTDAAPPPSSCLDDCVRAGQMKATSPEQIEADCRRACGVPPASP